MAIDYGALLEGTENIRIGPCLVSWGETNLGLTQGVTMSVSVKTAPSEEIGLPMHYDHIVEEMEVTATVTLAETNVEKIAALFPWTTSETTSVSISDGSGKKLRQYAQALVLTPMDEAADIVTLPMAVPIAEMKSKFSSKDVRSVDVTFQALVKDVDDLTLIEFSAQGE